ncbi:hypothetical protein LNT45_27440, partial [Klebsiella pneumoniae]|nr:hypothetical protein [Klebsiella pneumoniae]
MALTKKQREKLRMKFGGRCAYCGCELPEKGWHADHVQAVLRKSEQCMKAAEKGTVAKLAMRQPFVLFKGLTFQKLCLP